MAGAPELSHSVASPRETRHESKLSEDQRSAVGGFLTGKIRRIS